MLEHMACCLGAHGWLAGLCLVPLRLLMPAVPTTRVPTHRTEHHVCRCALPCPCICASFPALPCALCYPNILTSPAPALFSPCMAASIP